MTSGPDASAVEHVANGVDFVVPCIEYRDRATGRRSRVQRDGLPAQFDENHGSRTVCSGQENHRQHRSEHCRSENYASR